VHTRRSLNSLRSCAIFRTRLISCRFYPPCSSAFPYGFWEHCPFTVRSSLIRGGAEESVFLFSFSFFPNAGSAFLLTRLLSLLLSSFFIVLSLKDRWQRERSLLLGTGRILARFQSRQSLPLMCVVISPNGYRRLTI
jgi:hypothetical protein